MTARAGIQAGFGSSLGLETLALIKDQGFEIVRIDLQDQTNENTALLAQEVVDAGLQPLAIIRRAEQMRFLPEGALVEAANEPDIAKFGFSKNSYLQLARECVAVARETGQRLYVGVVSNLNSRGFDFLESLPWREWPDTICCSVHRYPEGASPRNPHKGSRSREDEIAKLRDIVGSRRPIACTETGFTLARRSDGQWSEDDQAQHLAFERRFWSQQGADFVVAFQINSGAGTDAESLYGLRRPDGSWRPAAAAFTGAI